MPERKQALSQLSVWVDFAKICQFLPLSVNDGHLRLKHILHDDNLLQKSAMIYALVALHLDQRYINVNLPVGSLKTIMNIVYYHSISRFQLQQRETSSYVIYTAQENVQLLAGQLYQISQSSGFTITTIDQQLQRKVYSNKRGNELKHESYFYDASSDFMKFNFCGVPERRADNVCSFDRTVLVVVACYEALARAEKDVARQLRRFQEENGLLRFDCGIMHLPDKQQQTFVMEAQ